MTASTTLAPLVGFLALLLPSAARAQQEDDWEGKIVSTIIAGPETGFRHQRFANVMRKMHLKEGKPYTHKQRDEDTKALFAMGSFKDVGIECKLVQGRIVVTVSVVEYALIESVTFRGQSVFTDVQLKAGLRVTPNGQLNPSAIQQDLNAITEQYKSKGYYFSKVKEREEEGTTGVKLVWDITEGPLVSVDSIEFSGNEHLDSSDLRKILLSKENDKILFIVTGKEPFVEQNVHEDIERIKLYYRLEGWLDIYPPTGQPERVFLEDLAFNEDKTKVAIRYHVEEGTRYKISDVIIRWANPNHLFDEAEVRSWLVSKPGEFYTENNANKDIRKIREKYGERAYINAEVSLEPQFQLKGDELRIVIEIKENEKVYVGKITIQGNTKTRDDVIRRSLTHENFVPGDEFNSIKLYKAVNRLRSFGWFGTDPTDPERGISVTHEPGEEPGASDVTLDIKEGQTGSIKFAAGFSSAYGVLGMIEFSQRNFDLVKWPKSFQDIVDGNAWAGGGQSFRIRLVPAQRRQSYSVDFHEPYVFGYEFGLGLQLYDVYTIQEDWTEKRIGGSVSVDKWLDPFRLSLTFNAYQMTIGGVDSNAPPAVVQLQGSSAVFSLAPAITFENLDSPIFPSQGARVTLSLEYAGQLLGGSFSYDKLWFQSQFFFPIFETERHLKHVLSLQWVTGLSFPRDGADSVPIFDRFYGGGRGSIRGFDWRGMGPHINGDPVGGDAYVFASAEYTFPLISEILRGAFFYDAANLTNEWDDLKSQKWRNSVGFGFRILVPALSNVPVALDFGFPLSKDQQDVTAVITFDVGRLY